MEGGRGAARGKRRGGVGLEEGGGVRGGILETAPVIISVSRHQGTWTANAHVSLRSFAVTR